MLYKKVFSTLLSIVVVLSVFSGCRGISTQKASLTSEQAIAAVEKLFKLSNVECNVQESSSDTLFIGIPSDINLTTSLLNTYRDYSREKKIETRNTIGWDDFIDTFESMSKSITDLLANSPYQHTLISMYNKADTSLIYLIFQDGVLEKDILKVD